MKKEPSHLEGYSVCACDWAGPKKGVFWTVDGVEVVHSINLMVMMDELLGLDLGKIRIVLEPMFESFGTQDGRDLFVERCNASDDVKLQRVSSRMTYWLRESEHIDAGHEKKLKDCKELMCKKTDESDVIRIWKLAHTVHCSSVLLNADPSEQEFTERSQQLNDEAMVLRKSGLKEELMASITEAIPMYKLPEELYDSLTTVTGKKRSYRSGVPSIWLATRESKNRKEFEKFLGLHGNGNSCLLRSDVYNWMWKFIRNKNTKTLSEFRADIRTFRHLLLMNPPEYRGLDDLS